jgi:hypothetical protein
MAFELAETALLQPRHHRVALLLAWRLGRECDFGRCFATRGGRPQRVFAPRCFGGFGL